ncbi:hypothetical protein N39L_10930 [Limnospira platensis NIES-39]|uniref:Uncharacterized protein n=1 Tax=Limnospira platensis NIES-46 TaxID=1236695 RepID=A0A5M3T470_LIMPL|nr:hypothetical protein N39L_10930 [Arthrospira platensis NIES-39]GCE92309.1 hypothetical protein NIES46_03480 [Arthrospira platensis NIES-46]
MEIHHPGDCITTSIIHQLRIWEEGHKTLALN